MEILDLSDIEKLSKSELKQLLKHGMVRIIMDIPISTLRDMKKEDTQEYKKHSQLAGRGISLSEAARKYDVPYTTIAQWVQRGIIRKLGQSGNKVLIDEADVAYCAEIRAQNPGSGRWLFNPDGTPYIKSD